MEKVDVKRCLTQSNCCQSQTKTNPHRIVGLGSMEKIPKAHSKANTLFLGLTMGLKRMSMHMKFVPATKALLRVLKGFVFVQNTTKRKSAMGFLL